MMFKIGLFTLKYLRHYDKLGNRLSKTTNNITEKYAYNVKNQLKELYNEKGTTYFTHDKQGNIIKEETNDGNNILEDNPLNQQIKAITKEGNTLVNRYDAEGLRYEIEENEKLTRFIFHKGNVLVETDKDYNTTSRFTRGYEIVADDIAECDLTGNKDLHPEAVTLLDESDIGRIKNTPKQQSTIDRDYKEKGERLKKKKEICEHKGKSFK